MDMFFYTAKHAFLWLMNWRENGASKTPKTNNYLLPQSLYIEKEGLFFCHMDPLTFQGSLSRL